jgi:hypothetical protein
LNSTRMMMQHELGVPPNTWRVSHDFTFSSTQSHDCKRKGRDKIAGMTQSANAAWSGTR